MAKPKTTVTEASVDSFLSGVADAQQRADARELLKMMQQITGQPPKMWGPTMVGFGEYHYVYDSGHEGDTFLAGFSPRKNALVVYFMAGLEERFANQLAKLGKVKTSKGCLYIKRLADVDVAVLQDMIRKNVDHLLALVKSRSEAKKKARKSARR
jgi:uncharacterized protein YdhG (YjbR/CyaY superfamily)